MPALPVSAFPDWLKSAKLIGTHRKVGLRVIVRKAPAEREFETVVQFDFILYVEIRVPKLRAVNKPAFCVVYRFSARRDVGLDGLAGKGIEVEFAACDNTLVRQRCIGCLCTQTKRVDVIKPLSPFRGIQQEFVPPFFLPMKRGGESKLVYCGVSWFVQVSRIEKISVLGFEKELVELARCNLVVARGFSADARVGMRG